MKKLNKATLILIASMLLLALTLVATFSWFPRAATVDETTFNKINVNPAHVYTKADTASVTTFKCDFVDGLIDESNKGDVSQGDNKSFTIKANECVYFKSIITDTSDYNNVSLTGLSLSGGTSDIKVCMLSPLKTTQVYSPGMTIAKHIPAQKSSTEAAVVEWYLYNSGSVEVKVTMTAPVVSISE